MKTGMVVLTESQVQALLRAVQETEAALRQRVDNEDGLRRHQRALEARISNQRNEVAALLRVLATTRVARDAYAAFVNEATMAEFLPIMSRIQRKKAAQTQEQAREREHEQERRQADQEDDRCDCCDCAADLHPRTPYEDLLADLGHIRPMGCAECD